MASADFCMDVPTPLDVGSTGVPLGTLADLPGYDAPTFTLMPVGFTSRRSVQVSGFADIRLLTPPCRLISASCSSGQCFAFGFLQISSRPEHPCRSANSSPCRASRGLPPPSECALPGAPKQPPRTSGVVEKLMSSSRIKKSSGCKASLDRDRQSSSQEYPPATKYCTACAVRVSALSSKSLPRTAAPSSAAAFTHSFATGVSPPPFTFRCVADTAPAQD